MNRYWDNSGRAGTVRRRRRLSDPAAEDRRQGRHDDGRRLQVRARQHAAAPGRVQAAAAAQILPSDPDGRVFYVYPDPTVCVCLYVGDQNAYATYRKNVFEQNLADEQAMTAQTMAMNDWDWGPWGGYPMGWYYY